jgi:hypothetical protein
MKKVLFIFVSFLIPLSIFAQQIDDADIEFLGFGVAGKIENDLSGVSGDFGLQGVWVKNNSTDMTKYVYVFLNIAGSGYNEMSDETKIDPGKSVCVTLHVPSGGKPRPSNVKITVSKQEKKSSWW